MRVRRESSGKTVAVRLPRDLRPRIERKSGGARVAYLVPLLVFNIGASRGSEVSGNRHFKPRPLAQLRDSIARYLASSALFERVDTAAHATADYLLETDVLHLVAHRYRVSETMSGLAGNFFASRRLYLPSATVVLRLRLRTRGGRLVATRVVNASFLGGPQFDWATLGFVARRALLNALVKARRLVASWVLAERTRATPAARIAARYAAKAHFSFLVHRVRDGRRGADVLEVEYPSGRVLRRRQLRDVPVVGEPGQWLVSPFDLDGVFYPAPVYAALTAKLAARFVLRRFEQLDVYRYIGPRSGAPPSSAPTSRPAAPTSQPTPAGDRPAPAPDDP